jgi:hypothetical protein
VLLVICWADRSTLWSALRLRAVSLLYQAAIQHNKILSMVDIECLRGQAKFLQPPEVEETLLRHFRSSVNLNLLIWKGGGHALSAVSCSPQSAPSFC